MFYRSSFDNSVAFFLLIMVFSMGSSAYRGFVKDEKNGKIKIFTKVIEEQVKLYNLKVPERDRWLAKWDNSSKKEKAKKIWLPSIIEDLETEVKVIVEKHHEMCTALKTYDKKLMIKLCNRVKPIENKFKFNTYSSYKNIKNPYVD